MPTFEPVRVIAVARASGGFRRLARLDPADGATYDRAVSRLVPAIEGSLWPCVWANRVRGRGAREWTSLEPWGPARRGFGRAMRRLAARGDVTMIDVRDCYGSIEPRVVEASLRGICREDVADVVRLLRRFENGGVRGLPIGPEPSAILANAILSGLDRAIGRSGARHVRWVDDVAMVGRDEAEAAHALEAAREALAELGLALNEQKTRVLPAEALRRSTSALVLSRPRARALP
ncbi:MAG TPA: RNA-directed DNA polymerase [Actinomycetota bacterium]|nr:RNA-directed DNA polymerase [Actinomycetota bacterium]